MIPCPTRAEQEETSTDVSKAKTTSVHASSCWGIAMPRARHLALALVVVVGLLPARLSAAADVKRLETQLTAVERQMATEQAVLRNLSGQTAAAYQAVESADRELAAAREHLVLVEAEASVTRAALTATRQRYAKAEAAYGATLASLSGLLRWTDAHGVIGYLSVLLGVHSFADFVARLEEIRAVVAFEHAGLVRLAALRQRLRTEVATLAREEAALAREAEETAAVERQLAAAAAVRQRELAVLVARESAVKAVEAALASQAQSLYAQIQALEAEVATGKITRSQLWAAVQSIARAYGIDPYLVWAVIREESGGNPTARSSAGALGLMQLMPSTAAMLGVTDPFNPQQNLTGGVKYLASLLKRFHGNVALALAAYNAGPGAVLDFGGIPPYPETRNYVKSILTMYEHGY
jgi:soluble lytic murein transglycosylase-like protein